MGFPSPAQAVRVVFVVLRRAGCVVDGHNLRFTSNLRVKQAVRNIPFGGETTKPSQSLLAVCRVHIDFFRE